MSMIVGTAALWVALGVAILVALGVRIDHERLAAAAPAALMALSVQALHFAEEFATGFDRRLPNLLGLSPWQPAFFVSFNMAWMALWLSRSGPRSSGASQSSRRR